VAVACLLLYVNCNEKTTKSSKATPLLINLALTGANQNLPEQKQEIMNVNTRAIVSPLTGTNRSNFIKTEVQEANSFITDATVRSAKYADMKVSSFDFYRATAHLYYKDLQSGLIGVPSLWKTTSGTKTWIQGDFHTQNVGFFDNDLGTVKLDVNDFDESYAAPFYWDLIRLVSSIFLQRTQVGFNFTLTEARASADAFLQEYQNSLTAVNGNSSEKTLELTSSNTDGITKNKIQDLVASKSNSILLAKWTVTPSGNRMFDLTNPDLTTMTASEWSDVSSGWNTYLTNLGSFYTSKGASYFTIKDKVKRLNSGLGSQGVKKYYLLLQGPSSSNSDDILLEIKEQKLPSLFLEGSLSVATYNSWFTTHANRSKTALKALLVNADNFSGAINGISLKYMVRKMSPYKYGFEPKDFTSKTDFNNFLKYAARAIAYAHSRSDNDYSSTYVNYNFENSALSAISAWPSTKSTIRDMGESYANQVVVDYNYFVSLVNSGQIF
jgi:uncharacterized protein (DUF2252 family)